MSKRLTDTEKWKTKFLRNLKPNYIVLWLYIMDECDHAAIWHVDMDVAQIRTGCRFDIDEALRQFSGKIVQFNDGQMWFIPEFLEVWYGQGLSKANRSLDSAISSLKSWGLMDDDGNLMPCDVYEGETKETVKDVKVKDTIDDRKEKFLTALTPYLSQYDEAMITEFFNYWSEPNKSQTKMRFEDQKYFHIGRRLGTWKANNSKYNQNGQVGKGINDTLNTFQELKSR